MKNNETFKENDVVKWEYKYAIRPYKHLKTRDFQIISADKVIQYCAERGLVATDLFKEWLKCRVIQELKFFIRILSITLPLFNASTTEVNEWLAQQKNIKIIDIKFHDTDICIIYEIGIA